MKYCNVSAYFSLDYENCPFTNSVGRLFCTYTVQYLSYTHKLHGHWLGVLYAWVNGYSTRPSYIAT